MKGNAVSIAAQIFAVLAALVHVYIFAMESLWWQRPSTRKVFGLSESEAASTKQLAFNQGFYNLFLAIMALAGAASWLLGYQVVGITLMTAGVGSMLLAAVVLICSSPDKAPASIKQGSLPLLSLASLLLAAAL